MTASGTTRATANRNDCRLRFLLLKLRKKTEKARKKIDDRLLKAYDKIRNSYRNGLAVVTVERDSCGGCFNKIPPQIQLEISMRKNVVACEHCGRILVDDHILEQEVKATES